MTYEELEVTMFTQLDYISGFVLSRYTIIMLTITCLVLLALNHITKTSLTTTESKKNLKVVNLVLSLFLFATLFLIFYIIIYPINTEHTWKQENLKPYIDGLEEHKVSNARIYQIDMVSKKPIKGVVYWTLGDSINKDRVEIIYSAKIEEPYLTYKVIEGDISYIKGKNPIYLKGDKVGYQLHLPKDYDFEKVYFVN